MRIPLALGAALLACLFTATAASQDLRWDIPHRGAHTYERATTVFEVIPPPSRLRPDVVILGGASGAPHKWRHRTSTKNGAPKNFEKTTFDDSKWPLGAGGFGPDIVKNPTHHTIWKSDVISLRTTVDLGRKKPKVLWFKVAHDDGLRIWLNGELIVADDGYGQSRQYFVSGKPLDAWRRGNNLLAVQCKNVGGAQYLDLSLSKFTSLPRGMRRQQDLQKAITEERNAANKVSRELFGPYRVPAMLLQGELDKNQEAVRFPVHDLRDIAWWVAMDLRCGVMGGSVSSQQTRMFQLGDLKIRGRATPVAEDGWQTIEATVKNTKEPLPLDDKKRFVQRHVARYVHFGFAGKLKIRRRIEVREGGVRVTEFETDLEGDILRGKNWKEVAASLRQQESWLLSMTHENQDTEFRLMVKRAIEKGTTKLRDQLKDTNGHYLKSQGAKAANSHNSGRLAIGLLALIKSGLPKDDEVIVKCLAELRKRPLIDTYSLGNALMVLEAYYAPGSEIGMLRDGTLDRPRRREIPADDLALMKKWSQQLMQNIDTRVDAAYLLRFNYTRGARWDNSLEQYGLLGLYAAHLCGVDVPSTSWEAAANHLLGVQQDDGDKINLALIDYRTFTRMQYNPDAPGTISQRTAHSNGWSYYGAENGGGEANAIWGSMTSAGITGLAICQGALNDYEDLQRRKLQNRADKARADGFAWLAKHMTVRYHPGAMERQRRFLYYYLYSLERAALLSGIAIIQDRDWYFEGAMMLVLAQLANGDWPAELSADAQIERNAMAILFLKQSTSPVLTGK